MPDKLRPDSILDFGTIDFNLIDGVMPAKLAGRENEAYYKLLMAIKVYRVVKDSASKIDSTSKISMLQKKENLDKAAKIFNEKCLEISSKYKGTLSGDIIANLLYTPDQKDYPNDKEIQKLSKIKFDREHSFDRIPFDDKRILLHNVFNRVLNLYSAKFSKRDTADRIIFIDKMMNQRKGVKEVDDYVFNFLMLKFVNNQDEISLSYLMQYSNTACSDDRVENLNENSKKLLTSLKNCVPGKKAFEISLPDTSAILSSLFEIASKNKVTLLFFWRSGCSHCKEYEPELLKLYEKYKASGLEIIGISTDKEEKDWKKFLRENKVSWKNLRPKTDLQLTQIDNNFPIPGTPTIIALDKNFVVKSRMVNRAILDKFLEQELK